MFVVEKVVEEVYLIESLQTQAIRIDRAIFMCSQMCSRLRREVVYLCLIQKLPLVNVCVSSSSYP